MIIPYELSLWIDYPGEKGIEEEKKAILATSAQRLYGRAGSIELSLSYTGQHTLSFDIPVRCMDAITGESIINPLVSQVQVKSKLKLWRDEKWFNPFAGDITYGDNGEIIYAGEWQQGRWYEFVVTERTEKRRKNELTYSYTATEAFTDELGKSGYDIEFAGVEEAALGMGTAHDLTEQTLEGTNWRYIKTETFPDYKEEFNPQTGETVKTSVRTEAIQFLNAPKAYGYVYEGTYTNEDSDLIANAFASEDLSAYYAGLDADGHIQWYKNATDKDNKHVTTDIYGQDENNIITSYADAYVCVDGGVIQNTDGKTYQHTKNVNLLDTVDGWTTTNDMNVITIDSEKITINETPEDPNAQTWDALKYTLRFEVHSTEQWLCNAQAEKKPIEQGDLLAVRARIVGTDGTPSGTDEQLQGWFAITNGAATDAQLNAAMNSGSTTDIVKFIGRVSFNASSTAANEFDCTYWVQVPYYVKNPHFCFYMGNKSSGFGWQVHSAYIYKLKGYNEELNNAIRTTIGSIGGFCGALDDSNKEFATKLAQNLPNTYTNINMTENTCTYNGEPYTIWLPFGRIVQNDYQTSTVKYSVEVYANGIYTQIFLPQPQNAKKVAGFNFDKRRAISIEKSNRFSIIQEICKTFYCFSRFMVQHEADGRISVDKGGNPCKYITLVSNLGREVGNGFNYMVNLESVERKLNGEDVVTKMYVENQDNEYDTNGLMTIVDSKYNKLGQQYIYNFNYYINRRIIDKEAFMRDYNEMFDDVSTSNRIIQYDLNPKMQPLESLIINLKSQDDVYDIAQKTLKSNAEKELALLKWDTYIKANGMPNNVFPNVQLNGNVADFATYYSQLYSDGTTSGTSSSGVQYDTLCGLSRNDIYSKFNNILMYQTNYLTIAKKREAIQESIQQNQELLDNLTAQYNKYMRRKTRATRVFEYKYARYINEGTWSADGYIDSDLYYADATRALSVSCMPRVEYSLSAMDLTKIANPLDPTDVNWGKSFIYDVGDSTYVRDYELFGDTEQRVMVAERKIYVDLDKSDDIELRNYETRFEDLFQSIAATVTTVSLNENIYSRADNFDPTGAIKTDILQNSFNNNKELVLSTTNDAVIWDGSGITIQDNDIQTNMLRAISKGIFLTRDGGVSYTTGITPNGINAEIITTGELDTSKIVIRNGDTPNFLWDTDGITAYATYATYTAPEEQSDEADIGFTRFDQFGFYGVRADKASSFEESWYKRIADSPYIPPQEPSPPHGYDDKNGYNRAIIEGIWPTSLFSLTKLGLTIGLFDREKRDLAYKEMGISSDRKVDDYIYADPSGNLVLSGVVRTNEALITDSLKVFGYGSEVSTGDPLLEVANGTLRLNGKIYGKGGKDRYLFLGANELDNPGFFYYDQTANTYDESVKAYLPSFQIWSKFDSYTQRTGSILGAYDTVRICSIQKGVPHNPTSISIIPQEDFGETYSGTSIYRPMIHMHDVVTLKRGLRAPNVRNGRRYNFFFDEGFSMYANTTLPVFDVKYQAGTILTFNGDASFIVSESDNRPTGYNTSLVLSVNTNKLNGTWTLNGSSIATTSDKNQKNSILNISPVYTKLFDNLTPRIYKYNNGTSDRYHTGFIAQEVNDALVAANISTQDFAGLVVANRGTEDEQWYLRYEEFIALNTYEIQQLKKRVTELENQIAELTNAK